MKISNLLLSNKDREILKEMWIWKLLTTAVIEGLYYPESKGQGAYRRLNKLSRAGLIRSLYTDCGKHVFWTLTQVGFNIIKSALGNLKEEGFKSEFPRHDLYSTAFHLGEWVYKRPAHVQFFSEQQLRRLDFLDYPSWVPRTDLHRPDGYWFIENGLDKNIIAIEMELNQKSYEEIESVANFYNEEGKSITVFWVVGSQKQAIKTNLKITSVIKSDSHNHNFLLLNDFLNQNWNAPVIIGKYKGLTVANVLNFKPDTGRTIVFKNPFFETNKARIKSITKKNLDSIKMLIAGP